ncbi:MAG: hypothetical protein ACOYN5_01410 [Bacteroidales bacterium]
MKNLTPQEAEKVVKLIAELTFIAKQLDDLEDKLIDKLDDDDEEAHSILDDAIDAADIQYKKIGEEISSIGGFDLMQYCIKKIPNDKDAHSVINAAWDGINSWQV